MKRLPIVSAAALWFAVSLIVAAQPRADGKQIFRFDTFGDEQLWTDTLHLHTVVSALSPSGALGFGLKVDSEALPDSIVSALRAGTVNLGDPAVTRQLLSLNAV